MISRRQITGRANCASQRGEIYLLLASCLASSSSGSIAAALHQRWPDSREHSRSRVHRKVDFPSANYSGNCARQLREIYSMRSLMGPLGDLGLRVWHVGHLVALQLHCIGRVAKCQFFYTVQIP